MKDLKSGIEHLKQAKEHMIEANGIMSDHISKLRALEDENAELRNELDDWKGNAEGFQPDAYMRLPLDADGVPIRIGDKMDVDGDCMNVLGYRLYNGELLLVVKKAEGGFAVYTPKPSSVRHYKYSKPDSWERLEADVERLADCCDVCDYFEGTDRKAHDCGHEDGFCCDLCVARDILRRAKKLAGIEEEARR